MLQHVSTVVRSVHQGVHPDRMNKAIAGRRAQGKGHTVLHLHLPLWDSICQSRPLLPHLLQLKGSTNDHFDSLEFWYRHQMTIVPPSRLSYNLDSCLFKKHHAAKLGSSQLDNMCFLNRQESKLQFRLLGGTAVI